MNVISRPAIRRAIERHHDAENWLENWWDTAKSRQWESLHDVRVDYPSADQVGDLLIFNASGNRYRLIVGVVYANEWAGGTLFVKYFLTHAEYDKNRWKGDA